MVKFVFCNSVLATAVRVHETNIAGFIYQVDVVDTSGQKHMVWTGKDGTACPGWLEVTFDKTQYTVNGVILYTKIAGWEEIDAVELIGDTDTSTTTTTTTTTVPSDLSPGTVSTTVSPRQWASGATASSEYTADRWSANQATGAPNTDACGDYLYCLGSCKFRLRSRMVKLVFCNSCTSYSCSCS
jgi:hypothetical protein